MRSFSRDLRPPILDDLGLLSAIEWLIAEFQEEYGLEVVLEVVGSGQRLPKESELPLFRVVQEALRNIVKHAQTLKAEVKVEFYKNKTIITISDNGIGFEFSDEFGILSRNGKLGLTGMQERVRLLGGRLEVKSELSSGTTVSVEVPV